LFLPTPFCRPTVISDCFAQAHVGVLIFKTCFLSTVAVLLLSAASSLATSSCIIFSGWAVHPRRRFVFSYLTVFFFFTNLMSCFLERRVGGRESAPSDVETTLSPNAQRKFSDPPFLCFLTVRLTRPEWAVTHTRFPGGLFLRRGQLGSRGERCVVFLFHALGLSRNVRPASLFCLFFFQVFMND